MSNHKNSYISNTHTFNSLGLINLKFFKHSTAKIINLQYAVGYGTATLYFPHGHTHSNILSNDHHSQESALSTLRVAFGLKHLL